MMKATSINYHYYIPDEIRDMFIFGLQHLRFPAHSGKSAEGRPLPINNDTVDDLVIEEESTGEICGSRVTVI